MIYFWRFNVKHRFVCVAELNLAKMLIFDEYYCLFYTKNVRNRFAFFIPVRRVALFKSFLFVWKYIDKASRRA